MDYVRWIFELDFCMRYLIIRKLGLEKLKVRWGKLRALKFEEKIRGREENNLLKICWNEKINRKKKIYIVGKKKNILIRMGGH